MKRLYKLLIILFLVMLTSNLHSQERISGKLMTKKSDLTTLNTHWMVLMDSAGTYYHIVMYNYMYEHVKDDLVEEDYYEFILIKLPNPEILDHNFRIISNRSSNNNTFKVIYDDTGETVILIDKGKFCFDVYYYLEHKKISKP